MSRRRSDLIPGLICAFLWLAVSVPAPGVPLTGVSFGTTEQAVLYDVDPATGAASNPRGTGVGHVVGVAYSADGVLYGLTNSTAPTSPNSLVTFNPATGVAHVVGSTGLTSIFEGDLAYDPVSGKLYGCYNLRGGQRELFTIDTQTGTATAITTSLPGDLSAMVCTYGGSLYALDTTQESLLKVNKSTGALISSQSLNLALGSTAGMTVDPYTGVCYVADGDSDGTDKLYTLDLATGVLTQVGPTGLPDGLAGLTLPTPEPATLALLGLGTVLLVKRRPRGTVTA
jgi:hypothetical protein